MNTEDKIKVVSYVRESTIQQGHHGYRPAVQNKSIKKYCDKHNFELVKTFSDWGSGGDTKKREDFLRMIDFVKEQKDIRFIVLKESDRFYRNLKEALNYEEELLDKYNVFVIDTMIDHSPRSYLTEGVGDMWDRRIDARKEAESELRKIKRRVTEGYTDKAARGEYLGPLCFGLKWLDDNAEYVGWDQSKTGIIREIFQLYATGTKGFTALATYLKKKGYSRTVVKRIKMKRSDGTDTDRKEYRSAPFTSDIVRSILTNKTYIGRQNTRKNFRLPTLNSNEDEESRQVYLKGLVSDELFNKAQKQISKNRRGKPAHKGKTNSRQKRTYLFQGMIKNNDCGHSLYCAAETLSDGRVVRRYICSGRKKGICSSPSVRADDIESQIIEFLRKIKFKHIDKIEKELRGIVKVSAKALTDVTLKKEYDTKHRKQLKSLEEIQRENYSWEVEITIQRLKLVIKDNERKEEMPNSFRIKYYDFIELRTLLTEISSAFEHMHNLMAQKDIIQILFKQISITRTTEQTDPFVFKSLLLSLHKEYKDGVAKEEQEDTDTKTAIELLALIKKFIPLLFSEIQVTGGRGDNDPKVIFKPTGLFLLLHDDSEKNKHKPMS